LIEGILKGNWVVFDNVEMSNPAILARLNPILDG